MTIWVDIEDLVRYFDEGKRPSGIQRVSFEMCRALYAQDGGKGEIRFCRHGRNASDLVTLDFAALEGAILSTAASGMAKPFSLPALTAPQPSKTRRLFTKAVPPLYRLPVSDIARGCRQVAAGLALLGKTARAHLSRPRGGRTRIGDRQYDLQYRPASLAPDDWLMNTGASWSIGYDRAFLDFLRGKNIRFGLLIYDLIPELFPEWTGYYVSKPYQSWLREIVPQAAAHFAISKSTAKDLQRCLARLGHEPRPVTVLPVGSMPRQRAVPAPETQGRPYVLFVSTIEIRKNHALLFRVWRRMLDEMPEQDVPDLVFAGKIGWMVQDFLEQLKNTALLNGKIRVVLAPSEPELVRLYQNCLFTVLPSFYEGWGLPVTESLGFGKTVAASRTSSIPEAGGSFCDYFDPNNLEDATKVIRQLIREPKRREDLEAKIAAQFKPNHWADSAALLAARLQDQDVSAALAAE